MNVVLDRRLRAVGPAALPADYGAPGKGRDAALSKWMRPRLWAAKCVAHLTVPIVRPA